MNPDQVTVLLEQAQAGDRAALDRILPLLYDELHRLARAQMGRERGGHTLGPTALVHEAYLKLVDQTRVDWKGRAHFFAVAATAMRRILVSHARQRRRLKRGGGEALLHLDDGLEVIDPASDVDLVALDDLLEQLTTFDARGASVVECRVFGGLSIEETAAALEISPMTVKRSWRLAKTWLKRELDASR